MQYFILSEDQRFTNSFKFNVDSLEIRSNEAVVTYSDFSKNISFCDFYIVKKLFNYFFFISDRFKLLLSSYADDFEAVPFFITSRDYQQQKLFWKIAIQELEFNCNPFNMNKAEKDQLFRIMQDKYIARVSFEKQQYIIISLHITENVLRKYFYGIKFIPIIHQKD